MGYYSEVAIKCEEKAYEKFKRVVEETETKPSTIYKDRDEYILYWGWVKWQDWYTGIQSFIKIMDWLDEHENNDGGYGYKFLRLGEEGADVESRTNDDHIELWMIREIELPYNTKPIWTNEEE